MRDDFDDDYYGTQESARSGWRARYGERISTWTGAAVGLAVIVGGALWVYNLGQRDASAVPVIRAALEPVKVQPEDPGGAKIAHQDITSYDVGAAERNPADPVILAPPASRAAEADVAMGTLASTESTAEPTAEPAGTETDSAETASTETASTETVAAETPPIEGDVDAPLPGEGTDIAPGFSPMVSRRPNDLSERMAVARQETPQEDVLAQQAAASVVQIQLGAFPDRAQTQAEWQRIYDANQDILTGRALVIQSTISGGRRFFRMRAGPFKDRTEARNICRALQARGQDCLVAVNG